MESYKLALKFFVNDASALTGHEFVPVFHRWIQTHAVADHLAIDVADYAHVHEGPGTLLITHEANFGTDNADGKLGLLYVRKQPFAHARTLTERLQSVLRSELEAAYRLESEASLAGKINFRTDTFLFRVYDRLLAPNNAATFEQVKPVLEAVVKELYGSAPAALEVNPSPEALFEVTVKAGASPKITELLNRLPAVASTAK